VFRLLNAVIRGGPADQRIAVRGTTSTGTTWS